MIYVCVCPQFHLVALDLCSLIEKRLTAKNTHMVQTDELTPFFLFSLITALVIIYILCLLRYDFRQADDINYLKNVALFEEKCWYGVILVLPDGLIVPCACTDISTWTQIYTLNTT